MYGWRRPVQPLYAGAVQWPGSGWCSWCVPDCTGLGWVVAALMSAFHPCITPALPGGGATTPHPPPWLVFCIISQTRRTTIAVESWECWQVLISDWKTSPPRPRPPVGHDPFSGPLFFPWGWWK